MKRYFKNSFIVIMIILALLAVGCSEKVNYNCKDEPKVDTGKSITIVGISDEDISLGLDEIKNYTETTQDVKVIRSSGEEQVYSVKGIMLEEILKKYDKSKNDYNAIRLEAGDGYSIEVPKEIIAIRDVILAYEIDGKPLDDKSKPIRVMIPDERSMYCLRNLSKIELITSTRNNTTSKVLLLQTAIKDLKLNDYTYYEDVDKAIKTSDLIDKYQINSTSDSVFIKSVDGLEKNENIDVFKSGYIKVTGKESPAFLSPDLPKGMHVKNILWLAYDDIAFFNIEAIIKSEEEVALTTFLKQIGFDKEEAIKVSCVDGYSKEITKDMFEAGYIYKKKDTYNIAFKDMPKDTKIKYVASIELVHK